VINKKLSTAAIVTAAIVMLAGMLILKSDAQSAVQTEKDVFGIQMFHPTKSGGNSWASDAATWPKTLPKQLNGTVPFDPLLTFNHGNAYYQIVGSGDNKELVVTNSTTDKSRVVPRIYIGDAATPNYWDNVEVTFYSKVVALLDGGVSWGGLQAVAKTVHHPDAVRNDAVNDDNRGYHGRIKFYGDSDVGKELNHSPNHNVQSKYVYPWGYKNPLPLQTWIGYKLIVRSVGDDAVHLQLYIDKTSNGDLSQQKWELLHDVIDVSQADDSIWPNYDSSYSNTSPDSYRLNSPYVGEPLVGKWKTKQNWVYIRTDSIQEQRYKWLSIREVAAEQPLKK